MPIGEKNRLTYFNTALRVLVTNLWNFLSVLGQRCGAGPCHVWKSEPFDYDIAHFPYRTNASPS
jgi:hypothetical protein